MSEVSSGRFAATAPEEADLARTQQQALRTIGDTRLRALVTRFATALDRGDAEAL